MAAANNVPPSKKQKYSGQKEDEDVDNPENDLSTQGHSGSWFLNLPAEARKLIYGFYFKDFPVRVRDVEQYGCCHSYCGCSDVHRPYQGLEILLVSKQVFKEALPVWFDTATFIFDDPSNATTPVWLTHIPLTFQAFYGANRFSKGPIPVVEPENFARMRNMIGSEHLLSLVSGSCVNYPISSKGRHRVIIPQQDLKLKRFTIDVKLAIKGGASGFLCTTYDDEFYEDYCENIEVASLAGPRRTLLKIAGEHLKQVMVINKKLQISLDVKLKRVHQVEGKEDTIDRPCFHVDTNQQAFIYKQSIIPGEQAYVRRVIEMMGFKLKT